MKVAILSGALATTSVLAVGLAAVAPAVAQDTGTLEQVLVTAQKRTERLVDVPIALSAVSGESIEKANLNTLEAIQFRVPSLTFRKGTTTRNSALFLRGLGTISFSIAAEPSVSTVIDGVVMSRSGQAFVDLYDLERVEVLRGPQGTLYGKNASAGVVSITTARPTQELQARANLAWFDGGEFQGKASISGSITDTLRGRITGAFSSYDGNIRNLFNGNDVNGWSRQAVRGIFEWDASEAVMLTFIGDWGKGDDDCCADVTGASRSPVQDAITGVVPMGDETREVNHDFVSRTQDETFGFSVQGDIQIGDGTVTTISAYRQWDNTEFREGDFLPSLNTIPVRPSHVGTFFLHDIGPQEWEQYTQEIRYASPGGARFEYLIGGFYSLAKSERSFTRDASVNCAVADGGTAPPPDATGFSPCIGEDIVTVFGSARADMTTRLGNLSAFASGNFDITERLEFFGGVRITRDSVEYTWERFNLTNEVTAFGVQNSTPLTVGRTTNTSLSGRAGLKFIINDVTNVYASYARGYKGPAFNIFFNFLAGADPTTPVNLIRQRPIEAETSDAFEIGLKSQLLDNRLQVNLAIFRADYHDYQANNFVSDLGVITTFLTNAGEVSTTGFELEFDALISDTFTMNGGVTYSDAQVDMFNIVEGATAPSAPDGSPLPLAPKWKASVFAEKFFSATDRYEIFVNTAVTYEGKRFSNFGMGGPLDSYALWDVSVGAADTDGRYRLAFVVKNILDTSYATLLVDGFRFQIPRTADRFWGVTFTVNIGEGN